MLNLLAAIFHDAVRMTPRSCIGDVYAVAGMLQPSHCNLQNTERDG